MRAQGQNPLAELCLTRLASFAEYDAENGGFRATFYRRGHAVQKGEAIGTKTAAGYLTVKINGRRYQVSHLVWLWHTGAMPSHSIDHINGVKDDNRVENLREATSSIQARNRKKRCDNSSGHTGIYRRKNRPNGAKIWEAGTGTGGRYIRIGYFETKEEAVEARQRHIERMSPAFTERHGL